MYFVRSFYLQSYNSTGFLKGESFDYQETLSNVALARPCQMSGVGLGITIHSSIILWLTRNGINHILIVI